MAKFQSVAFTRFSALILAAMIAMPMAAGNGKDVDTSKSNYPIGKGKISSGKRPKAPGIFDVYAWTEGGTLTVQFVRPAGVCGMTVTSASDPVGQTYTFPSEAPFSTSVDITDPELSLEIVTEEGTTYIGEIPVE